MRSAGGGASAPVRALRSVEPRERRDRPVPHSAPVPAERFGAMPGPDAAGAMIDGLLRLVAVSHWTFGRVTPSGTFGSLIGSHVDDAERRRLEHEYARRRTAEPSGPRMIPTRTGVAPSVSGVTMIFGDASADRAVLTLRRDAALAAFTPREHDILAVALDAISDRLAPPPPTAGHLVAVDDEDDAGELAAAASGGAFYILGTDLRIVMAWNAGAPSEPAGAPPDAVRLPAAIERAVRSLTAAWAPGARNEPGVARPVPLLAVRAHPMSGPAGLFIAVHVDRVEPPGSLADAAARFHITPREVQVLALLLGGERLAQIGERLSITASTVQDHVRSMVEKTGSRNRSELIARILGWPSPEG